MIGFAAGRRRRPARAAPRPAQGRGASPSRPRPPWCGHAKSSAGPCPARPDASDAVSPSATRRPSCRYCSFRSCPILIAGLSANSSVRRSVAAVVTASAPSTIGGCVRFARAIAADALRLRKESCARRSRFERCMYHICLPQCQIQLARGEEIYGRHGSPAASPSRALSAFARFAAPSALRRSPAIRRGDVVVRDRRLDLEGAGNDKPRLVRHRQRLQRVALEQPVDLVGQIGRAPRPWRESRARKRLSRPPRPTASRLSPSRRRDRAACAGCRATTCALGRERKAQHRVGRAFLPRHNAGPLGTALGRPPASAIALRASLRLRRVL